MYERDVYRAGLYSIIECGVGRISVYVREMCKSVERRVLRTLAPFISSWLASFIESGVT